MWRLASDYEEPSIVQDLEVMRDRGLRDREEFADLATGELARRRDFLDHPKPSGFRQRFQDAQQSLVVHDVLAVHALAMATGILRILVFALRVSFWNATFWRCG